MNTCLWEEVNVNGHVWYKAFKTNPLLCSWPEPRSKLTIFTDQAHNICIGFNVHLRNNQGCGLTKEPKDLLICLHDRQWHACHFQWGHKRARHHPGNNDGTILCNQENYLKWPPANITTTAIFYVKWFTIVILVYINKNDTSLLHKDKLFLHLLVSLTKTADGSLSDHSHLQARQSTQIIHT